MRFIPVKLRAMSKTTITGGDGTRYEITKAYGELDLPAVKEWLDANIKQPPRAKPVSINNVKYHFKTRKEYTEADVLRAFVALGFLKPCSNGKEETDKR